MKRSTVQIAALLLLVLLLNACVPGASSLVKAPKFKLLTQDSGLVRLNPPGVGSPSATFLFNLEVQNPNSFRLSLAGLDFDLFVNEKWSVRGSFTEGLTLEANGSTQLPLEVDVPLERGIGLLADLAGLIIGEPTRYKIDGTVAVEVLGTRQTLPSATLVSGTITQPIRLAAPDIRFVSERSGLRDVGLTRATIEVGLELSNPSPLGYVFRAPELDMRLGGASVGVGRAVTQALPAGGDAPLSLQVDVNPVALASQLVTLQTGRGLEFAILGGFSLGLPGILDRDFAAQNLVSGLLR